jgi:hypothetical protein
MIFLLLLPARTADADFITRIFCASAKVASQIHLYIPRRILVPYDPLRCRQAFTISNIPISPLLSAKSFNFSNSLLLHSLSLSLSLSVSLFTFLFPPFKSFHYASLDYKQLLFLSFTLYTKIIIHTV